RHRARAGTEAVPAVEYEDRWLSRIASAHTFRRNATRCASWGVRLLGCLKSTTLPAPKLKEERFSHASRLSFYGQKDPFRQAGHPSRQGQVPQRRWYQDNR